MPSEPPQELPSEKGREIVEYSSGGDVDWLPLPLTAKKFTNAFVLRDDKILLGLKKRGFGKGKYNGFGGKVDPSIDGSSIEAATRELKEEAGITAPLEHAGILQFMTQNTPQWMHIDIYRSNNFSGEISESEEMLPRWFALPSDLNNLLGDQRTNEHDPIPFAMMWDDDMHWFPLLLSNQNFVGRADFIETSPNTFEMGRYWFGVYKT